MPQRARTSSRAAVGSGADYRRGIVRIDVQRRFQIPDARRQGSGEVQNGLLIAGHIVEVAHKRIKRRKSKTVKRAGRSGRSAPPSIERLGQRVGNVRPKRFEQHR